MLAANREPERFAQLIMVGPSPRYINDAPATSAASSAPDIEGLLEMMDKNYIGWANFLAPAIMKNPDRPELGEELHRELLLDRPGDRAAVRRGDVLRRQPRRPAGACACRRSILQCSEDMIAPLEVGEYLHRDAAGQHAAA